MIYGVILAGGRGERFWPLSRADRPKQLLRLISSKTMLQETIDRVAPLIPMERILVVTSEDMTPMILEEIKSIRPDNILEEPMGRDTCLAIGLAAKHIKRLDPEAVMVVLSADHLIRPAERLLDLIGAGAQVAAEEDRLITIGINPTRPETNYGYIRLARPYREINGISIHEVDAFTEKPQIIAAQEYYYSRKYLWNSGMFIWSVDAILKAINQCQGEIGKLLEEYDARIGKKDEKEARLKLYESSHPISIDFAVLENAENVLTIKGEIIWDDIGSWTSLERYKDRDKDNNVVIGRSRHLETYETTIYNNDDEGIIVSLGVSDLVIVKTQDIVMVAHKTKVNEVKRLLHEMAGDKDTERYL